MDNIEKIEGKDSLNIGIDENIAISGSLTGGVEEVWQKTKSSAKSWPIRVISLAVVAVAIFLILMPMNWGYIIEAPGPTINVLASKTAKHPELIEIKNTKTYPTSGQLRMVTVNLIGGPERGVSLGQLLLAGINSEQKIIPEEDIYPKGIKRQEINQISVAQMQDSQKFAEVAALSEIGYNVGAKVKVSGVNEKSDSKGKLKTGDILTELILPNRKVKLDKPGILFDTMASLPPKTPIKVVFERGGKVQTTEIISTPRPDKRPGSLLGIFVDIDIQLPFDINIVLDNVGGPSAGLVFALGIIDKLTPGNLTGGKRIAVTGEIDYQGQVGAIGGVQQKIYGAKKDGAQWFLLPKENCAGITNPDVLPTVPVENLKQALKVVQKIAAGNTANLPKCSFK